MIAMTDTNLPLVSVIMPAYNAEKYIAETIDSVRKQTWKNWELIIIDDCSSDKTTEIVESFIKSDDRIFLVRLDKNQGGPAGPRNTGVKNARGEWVAFLDSDDIWHPRKIELQLTKTITSGQEFSCTQMNDFYGTSEINFKTPIKINSRLLSYWTQQIKGRIPTSSVVARKSLLLSFPFNENPKYRAVEDYQCWLRILSAGKACLKISFPLLFYRKSPGQISGSKISQLQKVFMVHREMANGKISKPLILTATHALGAFYFRIIQKGL